MQALFKPITVSVSMFGGSAAVRYANWRQTKYEMAWKNELCRCDGTGEDAASAAWGRFGAQLLLTIPNRFIKLAKEATYIPDLVMVWTWSAADFFTVLRFFTRLMFTFLVFKMIGRNSIQYLIEPDSIFWTHKGPLDVSKYEADAKWWQGVAAPVVGVTRPVAAALGALAQ